jgi:hypothetical protein
VSALLLAVMLWQLAKVRGALALANASLTSSRKDTDAIRGQLDLFIARFREAQTSWDEDRARLLSANHNLMESSRNALDVIRATLSRSDVPAHLAGEFAISVLGQGPAGSTAARADGADAMPPITRPPTRTAAGDGEP